MTINLCLWLDSSLEKMSSGVLDFDKTHPTYLAWKDSRLTGYLLPAVSEFAAIMAAIFYELLKRVGKPNHIELEGVSISHLIYLHNYKQS